MKIIKAIAIRDFKSIVFSPLFLFLLGLVSCLWSYGFPRQLIMFSMQSASQPMDLHTSVLFSHFSSLLFIVMVLIPLFTMSLLAEEKGQRTYDLILTAPITATEIAIGKYIGGFLAVAVLVVASFIYPLIAVYFAEFNLGPLWSSLLGVLLICSLFVSVGLLSSALTSSTMISVIMGFMFNFMIWVVGQGAMSFSDKEFFIDLGEQFSASYHFSAFLNGKVSLGAIVFFLSLSIFCIFLTQRVIESSRWRS